MPNLHRIDMVVMIVVQLLPIWLVLRFNVKGAIIGAIAYWALVAFWGDVLSSFDPNRQNGPTDSLWYVFGLLFAFGYCFTIYWIKLAVLHARRRSPDQLKIDENVKVEPTEEEADSCL